MNYSPKIEELVESFLHPKNRCRLIPDPKSKNHVISIDCETGEPLHRHLAKNGKPVKGIFLADRVTAADLA